MSPRKDHREVPLLLVLKFTNRSSWQCADTLIQLCKKLQTATGAKDKIAQHWIDILLVKARKMKAENPGNSIDEIAKELREWHEVQPGDKMNPLLLLVSDVVQVVMSSGAKTDHH